MLSCCDSPNMPDIVKGIDTETLTSPNAPIKSNQSCPTSRESAVASVKEFLNPATKKSDVNSHTRPKCEFF